MNSDAPSSGKGISATTWPPAKVNAKTDMICPNDITVPAPKEKKKSADEALERAGSIMANMVSSDLDWNNMCRSDNDNESDNDGGLRTAKSSMASFGRWTREEHEAFLLGLKEYGREWKKVADMIPTRNSAQIRSHAQKYFAKLSKEGNAHPLSLENESTVKSHFDLALSKSGLSSSILAKIDQITRDPCGVQREVELTLKKLRERYIHLQSQLEKSRKLVERSPLVLALFPAQAVHTPLAGPATAALNLEGDIPESDFDLGMITAWTTDAPQPSPRNVKTCRKKFLPFEESAIIERDSSVREFGSEELIALEVLRGGLPKGFTSSTTTSCGTSSGFIEAAIEEKGMVNNSRKRRIDVIPETESEVLPRE